MWHVVPGGETLRRWWNHPLANYALLLSTTMLLLVLGIVMVFSASNVVTYAAGDGVGLTVTQKQLMFAVVGLAAMVLISRASVAGIRKAAPLPADRGVHRPVPGVRPGIGVSVYGQRNWINFGGPFQFQPSELAKLAIIVWGADLLTRKRKVIHEWRHLLVPLVPVWFAIVVLIVLEGDLGTTIVMFPILASLLFVIGAPARCSASHSADCSSWWPCCRSPSPTGCNVSGPGWIRASDPAGPATSDPWPVRPGHRWAGGHRTRSQPREMGRSAGGHTDFIFAVIGEELGLIGTVSVLAMFAIIAVVGVRVARTSDDLFVKLATGGLLAWIIGQAPINIRAVLGLLPITGLPLPMVSYGGSSLLMCLCAIGILLAFARNEPETAAALRARRGDDRTRLITPRVRH